MSKEVATTPDELSDNYLSNFTGSCKFTKWSVLFARDVLTDGAHHVATKAQAFWLMDLIASHQRSLRDEDFQVWHLVCQPVACKLPPQVGARLNKHRQEHDAIVWGEDGNDNVKAVQIIPYTDFPRREIKFFACRNELGGITIMLPGEY